jgi:hypothetical protein
MILLINCDKEVAKEKKENAAISNTVNNSAAHQKFTSRMPVDYTQFNPCTQEYVHVTGFTEYSVIWDTVKNSIHYTYHFQYDGVRGVGLTSGLKYKGTGHVTEHDQYVWDGQLYQLKKTNITNKIIFSSKNGGNNFSSYAYYHFNVNNDGSLRTDKSKFEPGYCQ